MLLSIMSGSSETIRHKAPGPSGQSRGSATSVSSRSFPPSRYHSPAPTDADDSRRLSFCSVSSADSFPVCPESTFYPLSSVKCTDCPSRHSSLPPSPLGVSSPDSSLDCLTAETRASERQQGTSEASTDAVSENSFKHFQDVSGIPDFLRSESTSNSTSDLGSQEWLPDICDESPVDFTYNPFSQAFVGTPVGDSFPVAWSSATAPDTPPDTTTGPGEPKAGRPPSRIATAMRRTPQSSREGFAALKKEPSLRQPMPPPPPAVPLPSRRCQWLRALPVVFLMVLVAYILAVFVMYHALPLLQLNVPDHLKAISAYNRGLFELVGVGILTTLFLISYWLAVITRPGSIPDDDEWSYLSQETGDVERLPSAVEVKKTGARRHCKWCRRLKPDRAHHCRVCRQCVLKMDHHCPWIYNCVGWNNHKYFMLSLIYGSLTSLLIAVCMFESVKRLVSSEKTEFEKMFMVLFAETLDIFLCMLITGFFFFHLHLVRNGMTTIEFCEKQFKRPRAPAQENLWNKGSWRNFIDAFGPNPLLWFLPIDNRQGDGVHFITEGTRLLNDTDVRARGFDPIIEPEVSD
ncbi:cell cycle regulator with zn-finger domain-containing protein [Cystoisospora suis]|uniref:Palmitoyltransferase n=1 Tax=Cystoisospora suis TaxID=483139 RepID=A0A2C6KY30_9APIC|nr:cell cycle regulator with zn-finger domain-containing protein [Cystoisospora suis]